MTKRNRLLFAAMMLLPLGLAAQSPVGLWKFSVPTQDGKMIPLTVNIADNGTFALDFGADGTIDTKGKYSMDHDTMTIEETEGTECTAVGVYTIKVDEKTMTMTRVSDGCPNRGGPEGVMKMDRG
jgi:hypothetical protein